MGNVQKAMKKSGERDGSSGQTVVHVVSMAVAEAEAAAKRKLDEESIFEVPPPGPSEDRTVSGLEGLTEEAGDSAPVALQEEPLGSDRLEGARRATASKASATRSAGLSPMLLAHHEPRCEASEQIRQLRTSLVRLAGQGPVRCLITSAQPREGKSVTAANLGYSFSEISQKQTLVIDADLRRGRIAELFGLDEQMGLAELLTRRCDAAEAVHTVGRSNLHVIVAGDANADRIGELLSSNQTEKTMRDLICRYDHVIVDAPPALGVADACIVGRWVDVPLLAVRMCKTPKGIVEQAKQALENAGVNLAGLIALEGKTRRRKAYYSGYKD